MFAARPLLSTIFAIWSAGAFADPLAAMDGAWNGAGWARETPQGPQETIRCRLVNTFDDAKLELSISGRCVVPGRQITLSGQIRGNEESERISGRWSNPDGIGNVRIAGIQRDDIVAFTFRATDPVTGNDLAQNIEWRLSDGTLRLRSSDRANPDIMMSDMTFTR